MKKISKNKNLLFYPVALFHKNTKVKLYYDETNRVKSNSINNFLEFNKRIFIRLMQNLVSLMKKFGDKKIDILKLDIEGVAGKSFDSHNKKKGLSFTNSICIRCSFELCQIF